MAADDFADLPRDVFWVATLGYLAEVCAFLGDKSRAATLYQLLLPYDGLNMVVGFMAVCYGAVARYLGLLAATQGHNEETAVHFEAALQMNVDMGTAPWLAHTQVQYAAMRLESGQPDHSDKGSELLVNAANIAHDLNMPTLIDQIATLESAH